MYTTLVRGLRGLRAPSRRGSDAALGPESPGKARSSKPKIDVGQLENRTLFSATPIVLDAFQVDSVEDAPNTEIDLNALFNVDDNGGNATFTVVDNAQPGIVESASIDNDTGTLTLDYVADAHGKASVVVQGVNGGVTELLTVEIDLESVNDAPTAINLQDVTVSGDGQTVIDLFAAFDDVEDADSDLTYEILENTNESLFSSVEFDLNRGLLILEHAEGASGTAELTLQATDTGRLSVGAGTHDDFAVYDVIRGEDGIGRPSGTSEIGLSEIHLWTHWFFFEYTDSGYDFSELDSEKLANALVEHTSYGDSNIPLVFDIETYGFDNTPDGRDAFAEAFHIANEIAPEFEIGLYRFMPARSWWEPVNYHIALEHAELNIQTGFTQRMEGVVENYEQWKLENSYYRTEDVTELYGGTPLADMVDSINASLYTFYRNRDAEPIWKRAEFDSETDTFTVDGPSFDSVEVVRFKRTVDGRYRNGIQEWTDYYVVNADGNQFQVAATPGGEALDFTDDYDGEVIVGAETFDNMWHDPYVVQWENYALDNIAEARKFEDKPIYAWLSPSFRGAGEDYMEGDFFRWQLELLRTEVDGIVIYDENHQDAHFHENSGWWTALRDFMETLDTPSATTVITVSTEAQAPTNFAPLATSDVLETSEGQQLQIDAATLLANDFDFDGDSLSVEIMTDPTNGDLQLIGPGQWRYSPTENFNGTDLFSYRVYDGTQYSEVTTVEVNVVGVNDRPIATDDSFVMLEDTTFSIYAAQLLENDSDPEGEPLQFRLGTGPSNGTISLNADGSIYYRPDRNFTGDDRFTYVVSDGEHESEASVDLSVMGENDRPIAVADRLELIEAGALQIPVQDLLANDVDVEGDDLTLVVTREPKHGSLIFDGTNYVYIPDDGFAGSDYFHYRVNDGSLDSMETLVEIAVLPTNTTPDAEGEKFVIKEDANLVLHPDALLANDFDADADELTIELVDAPSNGNVRWTRDGKLVYVPPAGYSGSDEFTYLVSDGQAESDVVTVTIEIRNINDRPDAQNDSYRMKAGQTLDVGGAGVLDNDSDDEGHTLRVELNRNVRNGRLRLAADGTFTYTPNRGFSGTDRFVYSVIDELGAISTATAVINIDPVLNISGGLQPLNAPFTLGGPITGAFGGTLTGATRSFEPEPLKSDDDDENKKDRGQGRAYVP